MGRGLILAPDSVLHASPIRTADYPYLTLIVIFSETSGGLNG
jgi:hypothetical protein